MPTARHRAFGVLLASITACAHAGRGGSPSDVWVDLSPHGITGRVKAPESAHVHVGEEGLEIEAGEHYHLIVTLGELDPLERKAEIVREYGPTFRRFLEDARNTVVYETSVAGKNRFHFFHVDGVGPVHYHCRTPRAGVPSVADVRHMILVCAQADIHAELASADPS